MPHIRLEYTENIGQAIRFPDLFAQLHETISTVGGIAIENCKSRAYGSPVYWIGRGQPTDAFVHLEIELLEGKPPELKQALGPACLELLRSYFGAAPAGLDLQISIAIREIPSEAYFKYPEL
jgi:5-carboxymethyl-2-hydroxymuconate isomerase